jgi:hypothetical protein
MKLMIKQYLASLKERGELDAMLPDLLSELGFNVISKPGRGTRQYGVDAVAVGKDPKDGAKKVFLFSIKAGDLGRADWAVGEQGLRASLIEARDYYVPTHIPGRYADLPVVICACFGGDMSEAVRGLVEQFFRQEQTASIEFQEWNGDLLAELLMSGVLRENALPSPARTSFRKAVALVDEPDIAFAHFSSFIDALAKGAVETDRSCLTVVRQINLALWTIFVWARDAGNLEAPYLCAEKAVLSSWAIVASRLGGKSKVKIGLSEAMTNLIGLHLSISQLLLEERVIPFANVQHGLSSAVRSSSSLDVNLKLFDLIGRLALHGLNLCHVAGTMVRASASSEAQDSVNGAISRFREALVSLINSNPILVTPVMDSQAIEINLACLFLAAQGDLDSISNWTSLIAKATCFAFRTNGFYPTIFQDYRDLRDHPKPGAEYRNEATAGSILIPTLAVWSAITGNAEALAGMRDFTTSDYAHSTLQLWFPGSDTEEHLYIGRHSHGAAVTGLRVETDPHRMLEPIQKECIATDYFWKLSAVRRGHWPLVLIACRHHRHPIPPQFWQDGVMSGGLK